MRNTQTVIVLSVVATVLALGVGACIVINPLAAIGLVPILAAISLVIRAISGGPITDPDDSPEPIKAPPTDDGGVLGVRDAVASPEEADEDMLRRDGFAAGSVTLFGVPVLCTLPDPPTVPGDISLPDRIGMAHVAEIKATTEELRTAARRQGGLAGAVHAAAAHYGRLIQVPASESVSARLSSQLADLHNLAGWCCFDSGLDRLARWHYRTAVDLADRVGDDYQMSRALRFAGVIDAARGRPNDALRLYQLAQMKIGRQGDPELIAWLHAVSAGALAKMGHEQADDQLARARDSWQPPNIYHRADMDYQTALVHHELGRLELAEQFAGAVNGAGLHRPVGIFAGILRATVHVQAGEPRGTDLARQAIDEVAGLHSVRARERLAPLVAALAARPSSDARELAVHARRVAAVPA